MLAELSFQPDTHTYRFGNRVVPSVTQVLEPLQQLQGVSRETLALAQEFGTHVHLACHLHNVGELDRDALDPHLAPYLDGWIQFLSQTGFRVTYSEHRVYHARLAYAGTADVIGIWNRETCVIDIKSGQVPGTVGAQLAGYQVALTYDGIQASRRLCVQLTGDGGYKLHPQKDPSDWALFTSALNVYRYLNKRTPAHVDEYA